LRGYLERLERAVRDDVEAGNDAASAPGRLDLADYRSWAGYVPEHGLNVQKLWREFEDRQFGQ
ncbi:MAG: hypothetical protein JNJ60_23940, partial [Rhodocyclaceae bacterium]|nr:hypothetical protein [Rhodocyclaceae bacterium]